ncbi:MAG: DUF3127 domain-containing protein [Tannerellaceae bacterium]|jgi:hypothetical protein|nr:DUF3127 domain-containing protein [Tannerellaceae bacterium]
MEITGKIVLALPATEGVSRTGNRWKKQEFVLETQEQYPKKVCFGLFGSDRIDQAAIREGEVITAFIDIESREFNGKWYTNVNAWKVERAASGGAPTGFGGAVASPAGAYSSNYVAEPSNMPEYPPPTLEDDIPF